MKTDIESFDTQEKEIVKVLKDPAIPIDNKTIEDIDRTFGTITSVFPVDVPSSASPATLEQMQQAFDVYVTEKNKTL